MCNPQAMQEETFESSHPNAEQKYRTILVFHHVTLCPFLGLFQALFPFERLAGVDRLSIIELLGCSLSRASAMSSKSHVEGIQEEA